MMSCYNLYCFCVICGCIGLRNKDSSNINSTVFLSKCHGIEQLISLGKANITVHLKNVSGCYSWHAGWMIPILMYGICDASIPYCSMSSKTSEQVYIIIHLKRLAYWCDDREWTVDLNGWIVKCNYNTPDEIFQHFFVRYSLTYIHNPPIVIEGKKEKQSNFQIQQLSNYSGYVTEPRAFGSSGSFSGELKGLPGQVIMISVLRSCLSVPDTLLTLKYRKSNTSQETVEQMDVSYFASANIIVTTCIKLQHVFHGGRYFFVLYFNTFSYSNQPQILSSDLFNCSVSSYSAFQDHLLCNLKTECEDGRDETEHCPFSSHSCKGLVASHNKCFKLMPLKQSVSSFFGSFLCREIGGKLASIKTRMEQEDSLNIFKNFERISVGFGYTSGWHNVHFMYSKFAKWSDDTLMYNINPFGFKFQVLRTPYTVALWPEERWSHFLKSRKSLYGFLCEIPNSIRKSTPQSVSLQFDSLESDIRNIRQFLCICPNKQLSHAFLFSSLKRNCGQLRSPQVQKTSNASHWGKCPLSFYSVASIQGDAMFQCDDGIVTFSYTFVCDLRQDCADNSDETFCQHPSCNGFLCGNSQCVLLSQHWNQYSDCADDSDEIDHFYYESASPSFTSGRFHYTLDGTGHFTHKLLTDKESCPETHYSCTTESLHCLPVYTRCNGYNDCVYGEDEQNCETVLCPSYYRCRESKVCVHEDNLCDGWSQCPQQDDELLCDTSCPKGCLCQGYSIWCYTPFPVELFLNMRFLDVARTGMSTTDFNKTVYLIYLNMSYCSLRNISGIGLTNLQYFDLSNNYLRNLDMNVFVQLFNLRIVILRNNPLWEVTNHQLKQIHYSLRHMDLSRTYLNIFVHEMYLYLPYLRHLNLSCSGIETIEGLCFKNIPQLIELDIRWNPIRKFPFALFSKSHDLKDIFSSDYRLCCGIMFPKQMRTLKCLSAPVAFPSCRALIPFQMYSVFFWVLTIAATGGNLACFVTSSKFKKLFGSYFLREFAHFNIAEICMGINVVVVLIANAEFGEQYIQFESAWTRSVICKIGGFLFLISNEVSVLITFFITLNQILVLYSSQSSLIFSKMAENGMLIGIWFTGLCLSLVPFLPGLSHWGLSDQSGLCRLALFQGYQSHQKFRWFHVTVAINFMVCLLIAGGQFVIFKLTRAYIMTLDPAHRSVYRAVHLMRPVAIMEVMCWLSFGVVTTLIAAGVHVLDMLHGTLIVFVLPLNSALSPMVYMWNIVTQVRGKAREEKLLAKFKLSPEIKSKGYGNKHT